MNIRDSIVKYLENCKNQEQAIEYLRQVDFVFVPMQIFKGYFNRDTSLKFKLKKKHKRYSMMVREIGTHDYPYDYNLCFAIKLNGKKVSRIHVYSTAGYLQTIRLSWKDKEDINFKKTVNTLKFPEYLNYVERRKWRTEHLKHINTPGKHQVTDFYLDNKAIILEMSEGLGQS